MTSVYFYLSSEHIEITSVEYEGYPSFQKGEVISLEVKNNLPDRWDVENLPMKEYTIVKIEHRAIKYYGSSANSQTMMYVFLSELKS